MVAVICQLREVDCLNYSYFDAIEVQLQFFSQLL